MVGDPTGRSEERNLLDEATLEKNIVGIRGQLERLLGKSVTMANNADWTRPVSVLDFLRDVGKYMTVNYMLSKDSVKSRIESREQGISYTEFSYMLLQAFDFVHLAEANDCRLQLGGSDQWGNITCGIELQRKMGRKPIFGLVGPLLTTASGGKFGKTAAGTSVWLDRDMTSPYGFYQYWINAEDDDVERYLKMFTLVPLDEIAQIVADHAKDPGRRNAQRRLAQEVTTWVHGEESTRAAEAASEILFGRRHYEGHACGGAGATGGRDPDHGRPEEQNRKWLAHRRRPPRYRSREIEGSGATTSRSRWRLRQQRAFRRRGAAARRKRRSGRLDHRAPER